MILAESWRVSLQKTLVPRFGILEFPDVWAGFPCLLQKSHVSGIVCFFQTIFCVFLSGMSCSMLLYA